MCSSLCVFGLQRWTCFLCCLVVAGHVVYSDSCHRVKKSATFFGKANRSACERSNRNMKILFTNYSHNGQQSIIITMKVFAYIEVQLKPLQCSYNHHTAPRRSWSFTHNYDQQHYGVRRKERHRRPGFPARQSKVSVCKRNNLHWTAVYSICAENRVSQKRKLI